MLGKLRKWREAHSKPILVTEYGADTVAGLHTLPSVSFSEEFQDDFLREYFRAFDDAKAEGWFIGEMVWNFADFMTKQEARRVAGNKKGVFTRYRKGNFFYIFQFVYPWRWISWCSDQLLC